MNDKDKFLFLGACSGFFFLVGLYWLHSAVLSVVLPMIYCVCIKYLSDRGIL